MRVEAVGEMPKRAGVADVVGGDAGASLAIKNFLTAIDSDDSLFCIAQPLVGPAADKSVRDGVYSGDIILEFRQDERKSQRGLHFLLIEKLIELLKEAGSSESLETTLCLTSGSISVSASAGTSRTQDKPNQKELALWMRLAAKGDSPEQAVLRWGLGLAHLQQALLFTSRHLRQHIAQMNG
jgi:hypothetical protein